MKLNTKNLLTYLTDEEHKELKAHSKVTGISMNQLIKDYIKSLKENKENTLISDNFDDIKNLISQQKQIIDTTKIDERINKSTKDILDNNIDLIEIMNDKNSEDKIDILNNINTNFTSLIKTIESIQTANDERSNTMLLMIAYILFIHKKDFNLVINEVKENEGILYRIVNLIHNRKATSNK